MKNHLKWARIKIRGDGIICPSEISIKERLDKKIYPYLRKEESLIPNLDAGGRRKSLACHTGVGRVQERNWRSATVFGPTGNRVVSYRHGTPRDSWSLFK